VSDPHDPDRPADGSTPPPAPPPPGAPGPAADPPPAPFAPYGAPSTPGGPWGPGGAVGPGGNPYAPGGPGPWGPAPFDQQQHRVTTDAVSITGFVLSLTFCLSFVGVILGLVGLGRTKGGRRKGRWAAVSAIAVGAVLTVAAVSFAVLVGREVAAVVDPSEAEAGMCVDIEDEDDEVTFTERGCSDAHDGEIVQVGTLGDADTSRFTGPEEFCRAQMPQEAQARVDAVSTDLRWEIASEDPADPDADNRYLCYVEPRSGSLDAPILD